MKFKGVKFEYIVIKKAILRKQNTKSVFCLLNSNFKVITMKVSEMVMIQEVESP